MAELHVPRINRTVCTIPGFHNIRIPSHLTHEYDAHLVSREQNSTSIFTSPLNTSHPMAIPAHERISTIHTKQKHYTPINPTHSLACDNPAPPHSAAAAQSRVMLSHQPPTNHQRRSAFLTHATRRTFANITSFASAIIANAVIVCSWPCCLTGAESPGVLRSLKRRSMKGSRNGRRVSRTMPSQWQKLIRAAVVAWEWTLCAEVG
jgi:hypothetical protein